jgi:hypothetical protein
LRKRQRAAIDELLASTGPQLGYELMIAGLYESLEGSRADEPIDIEGKRNQAVFNIELRKWLKREAVKRCRPAAIAASLKILERRQRELEERR